MPEGSISRQNVAGSLDPLSYANGVVTRGSTAINTLWSRYADGRVYASQRPSIDIIGLAVPRGLPKKGRGIVYWDAVAGEASNGIYFVNNDVVYAGSYDNPLANKITAGREPIAFVEVGNFLVILDAENNQGWYINGAAPEQLFRIDNINFPGITSNTKLAGGGAELDGVLYVMDTRGNIYNSGANDPRTWAGLDFTQAQREQDGGIYLTKHHDNVVAIGSNSIEFFYNAGNPTGSPLLRRPDISYRTGGLDRKAVFTSGERVYFLGSEKIGTPGMWELAGFKLTKVSPDSIDRYIANTRVVSQYEFVMTGGYIGEHYLTFVTVLRPETDLTYTPIFTFSYDATHRVWGEFDSDIGSIDKFGMSGISERSSILRGDSVILFFSGDLASFNLGGNIQDISGEGQYVEDDYVAPSNESYVAGGIAQEEANIYMQVTTNETDFGSITNKFMARFAIIGDAVGIQEDETAPIRISWTDDMYNTFSTPRLWETGRRRSLPRLGKFKRRAFRLEYSGLERLRLEQFEYDVSMSEYA